MKISKWPIQTQILKGDDRILRTEYITKITELVLSLDQCKACGQCAKACPKGVISMPVIPKGQKVPLIDRMPIFPEPTKCVFCGVCLFSCPYKAISMNTDENPIPREELPLVKGKVLPEVIKIMVGKFELKDPNFHHPFYSKLVDRIGIKKLEKII